MRNEVLRLDDPKPFVYELQQYIRNLRYRSAANGQGTEDQR